MKIKYFGKNEKVLEAATFANEILTEPMFWDEILSVSKFDYSNLSTAEIVSRIKSCEKELIIQLYRPLWRWSKANAYVTKSRPNTLFLNSRKLWRKTSLIINTIVHECVHLADYGDGDNIISFGHGNNSSIGKENSAPYFIGNKASEFFESLGSDIAEVERLDDLDESLIVVE